MKIFKYIIPIYILIVVADGSFAQAPEINNKIILEENYQPEQGSIIIDGRPQNLFKISHLPGAINIQEAKFGEYLGKTITQENKFYLVAGDLSSLKHLMHQADSIGYSQEVLGAFVYNKTDGIKMDLFDKEDFIANPDKYTIIDIRSKQEYEENKIFPTALNFPLDRLSGEAKNIPDGKPIVVHCATGYRSTIGSSIIFNQIKNQRVLDMGAEVKEFRKNE